MNNFVLILQQFLDLDLQAAMDRVGQLRDARIRQFEHIVALELPVPGWMRATSVAHLARPAPDANAPGISPATPGG